MSNWASAGVFPIFWLQAPLRLVHHRNTHTKTVHVECGPLNGQLWWQSIAIGNDTKDFCGDNRFQNWGNEKGQY